MKEPRPRYRFGIKIKFAQKIKLLKEIVPQTIYIAREFKSFLIFLYSYLKDKLKFFSVHFEKNKNIIVKNILIKRGRRNRFFLHISAMSVLALGVLISPFITDQNPFSKSQNLLTFAQSVSAQEQTLAPEDVFETTASDKPRSQIITYTAQKGDTLSQIAKKFGISEDTIRWQNNLNNDNVGVGDTLEILPVTGVAYKVQSGDTIYTIAKKFNSQAQAIVDFPFNDFADPQTFSLVTGETLIVPNGSPATIKSNNYVPVQNYIPSAGPAIVTGAGFTWPIHGTMNQYFSWYHKAIDIGAPIGTPVMAANTGIVSTAISGGWNDGYGTHVIISGDNGYQTLYAHMRALNVSPGQRVTAGQSVIGWVGVTGRTTGPHLHFEIRSGHNFFDPLSFLH